MSGRQSFFASVLNMFVGNDGIDEETYKKKNDIPTPGGSAPVIPHNMSLADHFGGTPDGLPLPGGVPAIPTPVSDDASSDGYHPAIPMDVVKLDVGPAALEAGSRDSAIMQEEHEEYLDDQDDEEEDDGEEYDDERTVPSAGPYMSEKEKEILFEACEIDVCKLVEQGVYLIVPRTGAPQVLFTSDTTFYKFACSVRATIADDLGISLLMHPRDIGIFQNKYPECRREELRFLERNIYRLESQGIPREAFAPTISALHIMLEMPQNPRQQDAKANDTGAGVGSGYAAGSDKDSVVDPAEARHANGSSKHGEGLVRGVKEDSIRNRGVTPRELDSLRTQVEDSSSASAAASASASLNEVRYYRTQQMSLLNLYIMARNVREADLGLSSLRSASSAKGKDHANLATRRAALLSRANYAAGEGAYFAEALSKLRESGDEELAKAANLVYHTISSEIASATNAMEILKEAIKEVEKAEKATLPSFPEPAVPVASAAHKDKPPELVRNVTEF